MYKWTPNNAREIESALTKLVKNIPGIKDLGGASIRARKDFKIKFKHDSSWKDADYNLEFDGYTISAYTGALHIEVPDVVIQTITDHFPNAKYRKEKSIETNRHYWSNIKLRELFDKTEQVNS